VAVLGAEGEHLSRAATASRIRRRIGHELCSSAACGFCSFVLLLFPAYSRLCQLRSATRFAMLVRPSADNGVDGGGALTRMSENNNQGGSDPPHHPCVDGEPCVSPKGETSSDSADVRESEFVWPEPTVADERFYPPLKLDFARYEELLADFDMSEEERVALLEAMWNIVVSFVDLGFDLHPLQQIATAAEQDSKDASD
jgi:hypothetical protein